MKLFDQCIQFCSIQKLHISPGTFGSVSLSLLSLTQSQATRFTLHQVPDPRESTLALRGALQLPHSSNLRSSRYNHDLAASKRSKKLLDPIKSRCYSGVFFSSLLIHPGLLDSPSINKRSSTSFQMSIKLAVHWEKPLQLSRAIAVWPKSQGMDDRNLTSATVRTTFLERLGCQASSAGA